MTEPQTTASVVPEKLPFSMELQSTEIKEIVASLAKAQGEIENAQKDSKNPHFNSKYADLASIWKACRTQLSENGLAVTQQPLFVDKYGLVMVTTIFHTSGQWLRSYLPIDPAKKDPQGIGSAITYMRRYSLAAMVGVAPDDDDDGNAASMNKNTLEEQQNRIMHALKKADFILKTLSKDNVDILRDDARIIFKYLPAEKRDQVTAAIQKFEAPPAKEQQEKKAETNQKPETKSELPKELAKDWLDKALADLNKAKDMVEINKICDFLNQYKGHVPEKRTEAVRTVINSNKKRIEALQQRSHDRAPEVPANEAPVTNSTTTEETQAA